MKRRCVFIYHCFLQVSLFVDVFKKTRNPILGRDPSVENRWRKALKPGKNLAFNEDTCLEKERVRSKVTPRKVRVGLKRKQELNKERWSWRLAWWGSTEKREVFYLFGLRGRHQYRPALQSNQNFLFSLHSSRDRG